MLSSSAAQSAEVAVGCPLLMISEGDGSLADERKSSGHPNCMKWNRNTRKITVAQQYNWRCMECKTCEQCCEKGDDVSEPLDYKQKDEGLVKAYTPGVTEPNHVLRSVR